MHLLTYDIFSAGYLLAVMSSFGSCLFIDSILFQDSVFMRFRTVDSVGAPLRGYEAVRESMRLSIQASAEVSRLLPAPNCLAFEKVRFASCLCINDYRACVLQKRPVSDEECQTQKPKSDSSDSSHSDTGISSPSTLIMASIILFICILIVYL